MKEHFFTEGMNEQQAAAITAGAGPVLVLAGPGSGKTSVLTRRIAWLIREERIPHHRIMAVTFTNKAAGEMRSRVEALLGDRLRGLQIGTFHSACAKFLRADADMLGYRRNWIIYDSDDQLALMKRVLKVMELQASTGNARHLINRVSQAKCEMILPADYQARHYADEIVQRVYVAYQNALANANAMDFDDLLLNMVLVMKRNPARRGYYQSRFHAVLVDEFQDTNTVQYQLVKLFAAPQNNIFVVGDEDQSIYAFRGADYRNMRRFRRQYTASRQYLLEQNYRSTTHILNFARAVIDQNPNRTAKALHSDLGAGARVRLEEVYNDELQAEYLLENIKKLRQQKGLDYKDIAVMYRSNWLSRAIEQMLVREQIPYVMIGGVGFYKRREVKDMLAYLRLAHNPDDRVSFMRVINTPRRGIGDKSVAAFNAWAAAEDMAQGEALERLRDLAPAALPTAARRRIQQFAGRWMTWRELAASGELVKLFDRIYAETSYEDHLRKISDSEEVFDERRENVVEIWRMLGRAEGLGQTLDEFLVEQSLYADVDELEAGEDRLTLITLHSAKGLEYPAVFIVSVDESVLPHHRSLEEPGGLEEERRLFYVGITRAERFLLLNYTFHRGPSRFLFDLPRHLLDAKPSILNLLGSSDSLESQTRWDNAAPSVSRLERDLKSNTVTPSDSKIRNKIVPFPGSQPAAGGNDARFKIGQRVSHPEFGIGEVFGVEGDGAIINVIFDDHGLKKILSDAEGFKVTGE
ncbi:MAG: UvrD-helicase domain-containing protein [Chloroflexi bacterium]|nr:UvrD-helicase domain-containing protein [Chloroflexota bacterium]